MQNEKSGIERIVTQIESEYDIADNKPDERRCHRDHLAMLTVLMLRELSGLIKDISSDETMKKALSVRMDRLRAQGII
jgi:hypothetical protein